MYFNKLLKDVQNIQVIFFITNLSKPGPQILTLNAILTCKTQLSWNKSKRDNRKIFKEWTLKKGGPINEYILSDNLLIYCLTDQDLNEYY